MIRFYKTYLGRLLLGLLILIKLEEDGGKPAVMVQVQRWAGGTDDERDQVNHYLNAYVRGYEDESPSNDDVLKGVFGQLLKKKHEDSDLLDVIVSGLRLPFANHLAGGLKTLRDAILTPGELTELKKSFTKSSRCSCGHEFDQGEMATVSVGDGAIVLQCTACARPTYIRCDHCHESIHYGGKVVASWYNGADCGCRKRKEQATAAATGGAQSVLNDIRTRRAGRRIPAPTPREAEFMAWTTTIQQQATPTLAVDIETPQPTLTANNWNVDDEGDDL